MNAKSDRQRITPYVPTELARRLDAVCATTHVTESAYVTDALQRHMDGTGDMTLILRRMDRLGRALTRVHRDLELYSEAFGVFVRHALAHAPNVPEGRRDEMRARAESRYKKFVEHVAEQYSGGHRFLDDLPHEMVAHDAELDGILAKAGEDEEAAPRTTVKSPDGVRVGHPAQRASGHGSR
jgi:predicted DNA-binding protein